MQTISLSTSSSQDSLANPETKQALRLIYSLHELLADCENKIYSGEYTTIETTMERVLRHAVFTGQRKLELLGYYDNEYDDLLGK